MPVLSHKTGAVLKGGSNRLVTGSIGVEVTMNVLVVWKYAALPGNNLPRPGSSQTLAETMRDSSVVCGNLRAEVPVA
jgi:hypothetical protein